MVHPPLHRPFIAIMLLIVGAVAAGWDEIAESADSIPQIERDALIALYNATGGAGWHDRTNWRVAYGTAFNYAGTECDWYGISCDDGPNVVGIRLGNNNLVGSLPSAIADLSHLNEILLAFNDLSGSIPPELGSLVSLESLALFANQFEGPIPVELGNLHNLKVLSFWQNNLTGVIPSELGSLTGLKHLTLSGNQLTGSIPRELGNLVLLEVLGLDFNDLDGEIPEELSRLTNLQIFNATGNQLSGEIPLSIGDMTALTELSLAQNQLSGEIPASLWSLTSLEELVLDGNNLQGTIPPSVMNLLELRDLSLSGNQLHGHIPAEIGTLTSLAMLSLGTNRLSGPIPPEIGLLSALQVLQLAANSFVGEIPEEVLNLENLYETWGLIIQYNGLLSDDPIVKAFVDSKSSFWGVWERSQTVAPKDLTVISVGDHTAWLGWEEIVLASGGGGYELFVTLSGSDIWRSAGWTWDKRKKTFPVTGLEPGTTYDFAALTFSEPSSKNINLVVSEVGQSVMATTAELGCTAPAISVGRDLGLPISLTVEGEYDGFEWITGETTRSVQVIPSAPRWYWVITSGPGICEEAAVVFVDPDTVFSDGFEAGTTEMWSLTWNEI